MRCIDEGMHCTAWQAPLTELNCNVSVCGLVLALCVCLELGLQLLV